MEKKRIWGIVAFVGVVLAIGIFAINQGNKKYIDLVKNGSPISYPGITYEKAFNNYFGDGEWSYFVSEDDEDIVEFNGICSYQGKDAKIKVQFIVYYDMGRFEVYTIAINGTVQSTWDVATIIEMVFEDY